MNQVFRFWPVPTQGMDRLTVLCFAGTYALALAADLARFVVRVPAALERYSALGLTALGWLVQTAYLANRAMREHALPVTSVFESLLMLAWVLAAIALYLASRPDRLTAAGPVLLGLVLAVLVVAGQWAPQGRWGAWDGWLKFWGSVHGLFLLMGAVFTCLAFVFGVLYLAQSRRLKRKRPPGSGWPLPSLEQSERWNRAAITLAFPLLTAGILTGVVLNVAEHRSGGLMTLSWLDPKVLSTCALWVVFAGLLHARYRPEWRGRRVMVLTLVAFAFLAFSMVGVSLLLPTAHGQPRPGPQVEARP